MPKSPKSTAKRGQKAVSSPLRKPLRTTQGGWHNTQLKLGGKTGKPPRFPGRTGGR